MIKIKTLTIVVIFIALLFIMAVSVEHKNGSIDDFFIKDGEKDTDHDGWTDTQERIAQTNPFDVDTDHDGVLDSNDSNPHYPGILIDSKQKLEKSDLYTTDIRIPKGSTLKYYKYGIDIGFASGRTYNNYEINANYSQVLDFFLENMIHDGWRSSSSVCEIKHIPYGIYGTSMYYSKEKLDQPRYVTTLVIPDFER